MKFGRYILALLPALFLAACAGDKDNTEPPALLTTIENEVALALNWKLDTQARANRASYRLRPLLLGDFVYTIDTGGSIQKIDLSEGRRQWRFETGLAAIAGLGGNADLIVASSQDGDVIAYRPAEGGLEPLWSIRIDSEIRAVPVVDGKQVFLRSVDGKLRGLDSADGSLQWVVSKRVPSLSLTGNSEPLVRGEFVFSGFDDGKLAAYNRVDGQLLWETTISLPGGRTEVERLVDLDGRFVLRDGVIYISSFQGRLAAVQAVSGDLLWSRQFSSFQPLAIDDDALYLSTDDSHLWSIDRRTGTAFWKQDVLHARRITAPSILGDKLVVADYDGYLHWFTRADGKLIGRIKASESRSYVQPLTWGDAVLTLDKFGLLSSVSLDQ